MPALFPTHHFPFLINIVTSCSSQSSTEQSLRLAILRLTQHSTSHLILPLKIFQFISASLLPFNASTFPPIGSLPSMGKGHGLQIPALSLFAYMTFLSLSIHSLSMKETRNKNGSGESGCCMDELPRPSWNYN